MSNLNELDKSIKRIKEQSEIFESNNQVITKIGLLKDNLKDSVKEISEMNSKLVSVSNLIKADFDSIQKTLSENQAENERNIGVVFDSNQKLFRDLEFSLIPKLEKVSSDVIHSVRSEITTLEKSIKNEIADRFHTLNEIQNSRISELEARQKDMIEKQLKTVKSVLFVSIGITLLILILTAMNFK